MKTIIQYFIRRSVIANAIMFGLILASIMLWPKMGKEEMPEFAMNWVMVSIRYPGASAADVELFITKPIEEKLKGLTSLQEVQATSSFSSATFRIIFEPSTTNLTEKIQEVKDAIDATELPREVNDPIYRQFKSAEKAIIDIGIFYKNKEILSVDERYLLQEYALSLKNKMIALAHISGIDQNGYLRPELQIKIKPDQLTRHEITLGQIKDQIVAQNVRRPIGSLKDKFESEVTINSGLETVSAMNDVIISAGFQGQKLKLSQIAVIDRGFEESNSITKIQGHEGILFNVKKSANVDILKATDSIKNFIAEFEQQNPDAPIGIVLIDDESQDVRDRLALIGTNGLIGFVLIVIVLFIMLDFKSGVWVGMGIPFSLAFTLLLTHLMGLTINNMTLAAIIIVLGIVVDDAIIIAENIVRFRHQKGDHSATEAVVQMVGPVLASVLTTCAAFIPLYYFTGRFGLFVKVIPTVIMLMLLASLIESFFILPSHMVHPFKGENLFIRFFS
jgi:multidrug efflux pump subunit AcrB